MVTFPPRPVDIHGIFTCFHLRGRCSNLNLAIILPGLGSTSTLASGQAGKPNRNCQRLIPYSSEYSSFDRLFKFAQLTNCKRTTVLLAQNHGKLVVANNYNGPTDASSFFASTTSTTPAILTSLVRVDETN